MLIQGSPHIDHHLQRRLSLFNTTIWIWLYIKFSILAYRFSSNEYTKYTVSYTFLFTRLRLNMQRPQVIVTIDLISGRYIINTVSNNIRRGYRARTWFLRTIAAAYPRRVQRS
jgi:hypothetical protein